MRRLFEHLSYLKGNQNGGVLILVALLIPVLFGMAALAIDVGNLYAVRRQMVTAADSSALAAVIVPSNQQNRARDAAEKYALANGADLFSKNSDVIFSGSGDHVRVSVRASTEVDYFFAHIIPGVGNRTVVTAIATAQQGPGNPLAPFAREGHDHCVCDIVCGEPCECELECEPDNDCTCDICCDCEGFEGSNSWRIINENYECAKEGDVVLKFDHHHDAEFTSGSTNVVLLGEMKTQDIESTLAGGYTGSLSDIDIGEEVYERPGHRLGQLIPAIETRMEMAGGEGNVCTTYECVGEWHTCDMVLVIPIVVDKTGHRYWEIVGYVAVLLVVDEEADKKEVSGILIKYLTYEDLEDKLGGDLEGYVYRLVKNPENIFN